MFSNKRRWPTLVDVCDFNTLYLREHNANINTKNYLSSTTPLPPISYRDLRLVLTNPIPSNILILPKKSISQRQNKEHKKKGFDVYRSLARTVSYCSTTSERDLINDDTTVLTNLFTVDGISLLSNTGFFRTNNLPKIEKHSINSSNKIKTNYERMRSTPPELCHPTTPTSQYYEENNEKITTTTTVGSCMPKNRTRKQLHVYMPSVNC